MLYHLGRLPHIQEKLHQEVDRVVGKEKHITPDKIAKLSYLKAFLKESMRYYFCFYCFCLFFFYNIDAVYIFFSVRVTPIFTLSSRLLQKDVVLSGYRVPANVSSLLPYLPFSLSFVSVYRLVCCCICFCFVLFSSVCLPLKMSIFLFRFTTPALTQTGPYIV